MGGLGIVSFSGWFFLLIRKRFSLIGRQALQTSLSQGGAINLQRIILGVFLFTFAFECLGILLLYPHFRNIMGGEEALWQSLFHSVSAFCNAGFSLFPDSLARFQQNLPVNGVFIFLIVTGGLGFYILAELRRYLRHRISQWRKGKLRGRKGILSLHTRLALLSTVILIASGAILFLMLEGFNLLRHQSLPERILPALFHSVTTRTAGFNTLSINDMTNGSLFFTIFLMAIGGCPGSTAGGIKTTTVAILFVLLLSRFRGRPRCEILGRTIPRDLVSKALVTTALFIGITLMLTLVLQFSEQGFLPHGAVRGNFLELLFETVSAMGTVGLSTGFTAKLSVFGRLVITLAMLIGRLGPLTLALTLVGERPAAAYAYPEERVMIG